MPTPIVARLWDAGAGAVGPCAGVVVNAMAISRCSYNSWLGENHGVREQPPVILRLGCPCDKRSSRMMYQILVPKVGGSNLCTEVMPQGFTKSPHDYTWQSSYRSGKVPRTPEKQHTSGFTARTTNTV